MRNILEIAHAKNSVIEPTKEKNMVTNINSQSVKKKRDCGSRKETIFFSKKIHADPKNLG